MQCLNNETSSSSEISKELGCTEHDVDPGWEGLCVVAAINKFTWTTEILWRKGMAGPLSEREGERARERGPLPGQVFVAFLGTLY